MLVMAEELDAADKSSSKAPRFGVENYYMYANYMFDDYYYYCLTKGILCLEKQKLRIGSKVEEKVAALETQKAKFQEKVETLKQEINGKKADIRKLNSDILRMILFNT